MNEWIDKTKTNAIIDRHLMGKKTHLDPIGEVWIVPGENGGDGKVTSPLITKVNLIVCGKLGYTARELERMSIVELMTREDTIAAHFNKYFKESFSSAKSVVMRSHGQGFQMKCKDGSYKDVQLAIVFPREDPSLQGDRMIPQKQRESFVFGCLRIIFLEDFNRIIKD